MKHIKAYHKVQYSPKRRSGKKRTKQGGKMSSSPAQQCSARSIATQHFGSPAIFHLRYSDTHPQRPPLLSLLQMRVDNSILDSVYLCLIYAVFLFFILFSFLKFVLSSAFNLSCISTCHKKRRALQLGSNWGDVSCLTHRVFFPHTIFFSFFLSLGMQKPQVFIFLFFILFLYFLSSSHA